MLYVEYGLPGVVSRVVVLGALRAGSVVWCVCRLSFLARVLFVCATCECASLVLLLCGCL